jgi:anaerobic ribonucleoside-triphosphate reductase
MIRKIIKRDGKIADFNPLRITNAVWKAAQAVGGKDYKKSIELTDKVIENLEKNIKKGELATVEQVQDMVEKTLIEEGHARTAKAYILYRKQHQDMREIGGLLKDIDVVDGYLSMMDWKVQENSNMAYSLQGLNVYATENIVSHYWLNKIYPPELGDAHKKGSYHLHDLGTLGAYTYFGKETIIAKINSKIFLTSFQNLYEKLNYDEALLSKKDDAWAKYPDDLEVLDKDGWTKVKRVVKKAKNKPMRFIKNEGGRSVIVTEDHPMVLGDEIFKEAKDIKTEEDNLLTVDVQQLLSKENLFSKNHIFLAEELYNNGIFDFFIEGMPFEEYNKYSDKLDIDGIISTSNNADALPNKIELTENIGYLIGFYLAEGNMEPHRISIRQKDTNENQQIIKKLEKAAYELGCRLYSLKKDGFIDLRIVNTTFVKYLLGNIFNINGISKDKHLPDEILNYNQSFVEGIIAGIIDGDGSITTSKTSLVVRIASRTMLEQISTVMNILGFTVRDRNLEGVGSTRYYNDRQIIQHYPLYGISFRTIEKALPSFKYSSAEASSRAGRAEGYGWHKVLNNQTTEIVDDYIYDITTETHTLVVNGMWNHNCVGWDLKDILLLGFRGVSGKIESKPAKHFGTALMQVVNYLYTLQGEAAGAQALSNFDSLLAPFIRYDKLNYDQVKQEMQKFLFNMNVPTRVGFQSPFSNCTLDLTVPSYMTEEPVIIGGELKDETYSDFTDEMDMINHAFAEVMCEGDAKERPFTFPIPTYNITKDFDWGNNGLDPLWKMTAKYGVPYFSNFINSDMRPDDARSMCPLAGDEKVLIKSSRGRNFEYSMIRNIYEGNGHQDEYEIYSHGKFIKGKFNKWDNQKMLKIILENGHEIKMSQYHQNFVFKNSDDNNEYVLKAKELKSGMYLPYSLNEYDGDGGTEDLGYFVGAYAGDGSFDGDTSVIFSLENNYKKEVIERLTKIAKEYFGAHAKLIEYDDTKLVTLKVHSRAAVGLCKDYVEDKQRNKHYTARLFSTSKEFRKGVVKGHYDTDGGNRNRIYTSSPKMLETLNMLAATLGTTTSVYKDDREGRLGNEPNYAVLFYQLNRENYGDFWFKKDDKLWIKIKEIKPIKNSSAYCFEVKNGEPIFTVGTTGILTHNCRLRLDNRELRKRGGGLFGANPKTGSIGVVTINMPQIGYLARDDNEFFERLDALMDLAKESLIIKREVIENLTFSGLHPYSKFYLSDVKKTFGEYWKNHFSTIGVIGMNDALLNFMNKGIVDPQGKAFAEKVLDHMRDKLSDYQQETGDIFNLEATPAEGASYRLSRIDKAQYPDIRTYNQEFYGNGGKVEPYYTNSTQLPVGYTDDIFEALDLQDSLQSKYTGGTVLHVFLGENEPDFSATKKLVRKIAQNYTLPYFTMTPTFSICPKHGYLAGEHKYCPKCDEELGVNKKTKVVSRR